MNSIQDRSNSIWDRLNRFRTRFDRIKDRLKGIKDRWIKLVFEIDEMELNLDGIHFFKIGRIEFHLS